MLGAAVLFLAITLADRALARVDRIATGAADR
jgi:hypothetical protein